MSPVLEQLTGDLFSLDRPEEAPMRTLLPTFRRSIVRACATSCDGLIVCEFDARPALERATDEDIALLIDEAFVGAGPGCYRILERSGPDGETFLALTQQRNAVWQMTIDGRKAKEWVATQRPRLQHLLDPAMCLG